MSYSGDDVDLKVFWRGRRSTDDPVLFQTKIDDQRRVLREILDTYIVEEGGYVGINQNPPCQAVHLCLRYPQLMTTVSCLSAASPFPSSYAV